MAHYQTSAEAIFQQLVKRCVLCPPEQPSCPDCSSDETCSLIPQSCSDCASTTCVKIKTIPGQTQASGGSAPIGGIVGGVIGGVVVIIAVTYLLWRYCMRGTRRKDIWVPPEKTDIGRSANLQSRTNSIASTVLTRASNVIQIAYIPGVTVRSTPESPEIPPPMPSVPSSYMATSANTSPDLEQHFFMPSRDSTWSDATSMASGNRISLTPSLARASVATTIYPNDATVPPVPAQYAYQIQANMVSVRSGTTTPSSIRSGQTPPVPQVPTLQPVQALGGSKVVARNVTARPVEIRKNGGPNNGVPTMRKLATRSSQIRTREIPIPVFSDEKEVVVSSATASDGSSSIAMARLGQNHMNISSGGVSHVSSILPVSGTSAGGSGTNYDQHDPTADISAMIQNAIKSATSNTAQASQRPDLHKQDSGPFSDENEIQENIRNRV